MSDRWNSKRIRYKEGQQWNGKREEKLDIGKTTKVKYRESTGRFVLNIV